MFAGLIEPVVAQQSETSERLARAGTRKLRALAAEKRNGGKEANGGGSGGAGGGWVMIAAANAAVNGRGEVVRALVYSPNLILMRLNCGTHTPVFSYVQLLVVRGAFETVSG